MNALERVRVGGKITTFTAVQNVIAFPTFQDVVTVAALELVVILVTAQLVVVPGTDKVLDILQRIALGLTSGTRSRAQINNHTFRGVDIRV